MLGPYILCTRLYCFNRKTKNVLVFAILFYILFYFQFYLSISFLFAISVTPDILSYLLIICEGIHMTIPFQIIQRWIGKYKFYNPRILWLKKTCLGDSQDLSVIVVYYLQWQTQSRVLVEPPFPNKKLNISEICR